MACGVVVYPSLVNLRGDLGLDRPSAILDDPASGVLERCDPSMLVSAIGPYHHAVFNHVQRPRLVAEMRAVAAECEDEEIVANLREVADFIETEWPRDLEDPDYPNELGDSDAVVVFWGD